MPHGMACRRYHDCIRTAYLARFSALTSLHFTSRQRRGSLVGGFAQTRRGDEVCACSARPGCSGPRSVVQRCHVMSRTPRRVWRSRTTVSVAMWQCRSLAAGRNVRQRAGLQMKTSAGHRSNVAAARDAMACSQTTKHNRDSRETALKTLPPLRLSKPE